MLQQYGFIKKTAYAPLVNSMADFPDVQTYALNPTFRDQNNFKMIRNKFLTDTRFLCKKYKLHAWIVFELPPPPTPADVAQGKHITTPRLHSHMKVWSKNPVNIEALVSNYRKKYGNCTWKYADSDWDKYMTKQNDPHKQQYQLWKHYYINSGEATATRAGGAKSEALEPKGECELKQMAPK